MVFETVVQMAGDWAVLMVFLWAGRKVASKETHWVVAMAVKKAVSRAELWDMMTAVGKVSTAVERSVANWVGQLVGDWAVNWVASRAARTAFSRVDCLDESTDEMMVAWKAS